MKAVLSMCCIFWLLPSVAFAQLRWEKKQMDVKVTLDDAQATAQFKFVNEGKYPVTITRVRACCGLRVDILDKKTYAPGEAGVLTGVIAIGSAQGKVRKTMTVETNDPRGSNAVLDIDLQIPELIRVEPEEVYWYKDDDAPPKEMTIRVVYQTPFHITAVKSSSDKLAAKLETVKDGKEYKLILTPQEQFTETMGISLSLSTDLTAAGATKTLEVSVYVN